jgi:hypothetical protein
MWHHNIAIVTGQGDHLGTGHFQRMASVFLTKTPGHSFTLVMDELPDISEYPEINHSSSIPAHTTLILRDKRDSTVEEIDFLQQYAPVIAIDDHGPGSREAFQAIDLLPSLGINRIYRPELFLYGYNFIRGLTSLDSHGEQNYIAIYLGETTSEPLLAPLFQKLSAVTELQFIGTAPGGYSASSHSPSHVIAHSSIVITYFGITMFESFLCQKPVIAIQPSLYHNSLAETMSHKLLYNKGYFKKIDHDDIIETIERELSKTREEPKPEFMLNTVYNNLESFISFISSFHLN